MLLNQSDFPWGPDFFFLGFSLRGFVRGRPLFFAKTLGVYTLGSKKKENIKKRERKKKEDERETKKNGVMTCL